MSTFHSSSENDFGSWTGQTPNHKIYERTGSKINEAISAERSVLLESLPATGKTTKAVELINEYDDRLFTYLTKRSDLYGQAKDIAESNGLDPTIMPALFPDEKVSDRIHCPSFDENSVHYNSEAVDLYGHNIGAVELHDILELTCRDNCEYYEFWTNFDPEEHRVLIGHYTHAYKLRVTRNRTVFVDEFPGFAFEQSYGKEQITRFLQSIDEISLNSWDNLIETRDKDDEIARWIAENDITIDPRTLLETDTGHPYSVITPFLVWAIGESVPHGNGMGLPWINLERSETIPIAYCDREFKHNRRVVINHETVNSDQDEIHVLTQPDFSEANGVIGLDGTPTRELWELSLGEELEHWKTVDSADEKNYHLKERLGIEIRQVSDAIRPYSSGMYSNQNFDEAVIYGIEAKHGNKPAVVIPEKTRSQYEQSGVLDRTTDSINFAEVPSYNGFKGMELGFIPGSLHPGDHVLKRWAAYSGELIEGDGKGLEKTYGEFGDKIYRHFVHNQVLQAIFRFGRGECGSIVYLGTSATPDWVGIDVKSNVKLFKSENKREIADYLREREVGRTVADIGKCLNVSESTIRRTLKDFEDVGYVEKEWDGGHNVWRWTV